MFSFSSKPIILIECSFLDCQICCGVENKFKDPSKYEMIYLPFSTVLSGVEPNCQTCDSDSCLDRRDEIHAILIYDILSLKKNYSSYTKLD